MTRIEIATLVCKVIGLWMFAEAAMQGGWIIFLVVVAIGSTFSSGSFHGYKMSEVAVLGLPALGHLVVGLFLWFRASRLAMRMVSDDPAPVTRPQITAPDVLAIAVMTIGVSTLIPVLRAIARNVLAVLGGEYGVREWWSSATWQANTWSSIIGLALSIWLILGSRGIVRVVLWARAAAAKRGGESEAI